MKRIVGLIVIASLLVVSGCNCTGNESEKKTMPSFSLAPGFSSMDHAHVVFVNVGNALSDDDFVQSVTAIQKVMPIYVTGMTASQGITAADIAASWKNLKPLLGDKAVLVVFFANSESDPSYMTQPRHWAYVNLWETKSGTADASVLEKRLAKQSMKGLGLAAGLGGNPESRCVMYFNSFSADGIDATSASYGPYAYFPLQETLKNLSEGDIFKTE